MSRHRCAAGTHMIAADWGVQARKRAVYLARHETRWWSIGREDPPAGGWTLAALLDLARGLQAETGRAALIGVDAVLGISTAFARALGCDAFRSVVVRLSKAGGLEREAPSAEDWRAARPFFRVPAGRGALAAIIEAAGGRDVLLREVERRSGAKTVFALSGIPGTVGSGSRALWRELAPWLENADRDFAIWPFDGDLQELTDAGRIVLAEIYPRCAYAVATSEDLPARIEPLAKTRVAARHDAIDRLTRSAWLAAAEVDLRDLAAARENDDDFDALMTAAALVRLTAGGLPLSSDPVDPACEGGILPTGGLAL